jgi:DNA-binding MarR family transcriptional regulator
MAHTIRIMPDSEHTRAISAAEQAHGEALEQATTYVIRTLPRMFRTLKHQLRSTEMDSPHKDLGEQQMWVLYALTRGRKLTSELAKKFNVANPTITRTVDALVERGFVERQPDADDRRKIYLQLTPAGTKAGEFAHGQFRTTLGTFLSPLDESQLYDIVMACRHISTLMPENIYEYEYENSCPVQPRPMAEG